MRWIRVRYVVIFKIFHYKELEQSSTSSFNNVHCVLVLVSSGGVTSSPVAKQVQETEEVSHKKDWIRFCISFPFSFFLIHR